MTVGSMIERVSKLRLNDDMQRFVRMSPVNIALCITVAGRITRPQQPIDLSGTHDVRLRHNTVPNPRFLSRGGNIEAKTTAEVIGPDPNHRLFLISMTSSFAATANRAASSYRCMVRVGRWRNEWCHEYHLFVIYCRHAHELSKL